MIQINVSFPRPWIRSHRTESKLLKISEVPQNGLRQLWIKQPVTQPDQPHSIPHGGKNHFLQAVPMHVCT